MPAGAMRVADVAHTPPARATAAAGDGRAPSCEVCRQLGEAHGRYPALLRRDGRMRRGLAQALVSSMGFCPGHEQLLRGDPELRDWVGQCLDEARRGFARLLGRTRLQDEMLQEIVFGARSHCPACLYCRRLAGHCISRKLRDIQSGRAQASALLSDQLCFEHARQLVQRCDSGALKIRLKRALRRKGKAIVERLQAGGNGGVGTHAGACGAAGALLEYVFDTVQAASDTASMSDAGMASGEGAVSVEGAVSIEGAISISIESTVSVEGAPSAPGDGPAWACPCPVCRALRHARAAWLDAVDSTIRLQQPAWLALPACAEHLGICLPREMPAGRQVLARAYIEAAFAAPRKPKAAAVPVKKRPRSSLRWFDPPAQPQAEVPAGKAAVRGAAQAEEEGEEPSSYMQLRCPGCQALDIALRGAIASWLHAYADAPQAGQGGLTRQLCLKHLAEVLIYAPQESLRASILAHL